MTGLGLMLYVDRESLIYTDILHILPSTGLLVVLEKLPAILISFGALLVVLGFLGCYGACTENVCFLTTVSWHYQYENNGFGFLNVA